MIALTYERQIDNRHGIGVSLFNLGEVADILGNRGQGIHLLLASERALLEVGSPFTESIRQMLEAQSVAAGWDASQLAEGRASLQTLTVECCDWALTPVSDFLKENPQCDCYDPVS
jgi:hypothetical protein